MDNDVKVSSNGNGVGVSPEANAPDDSHLIVIVSQECYDTVKEIAERASGRGLQDGFQFWLERLACQHAKVQENLWNKADDGSMFARAQKGNTQAKLAVLASLGLKGEAAQKFLASIK